MTQSRQKQAYLLFVTALLLITQSLSHAQNMQEAVQIALQQYPSILAAQANERGAIADITRAQGAHWPQVAWSGTYNSYNAPGIPNNWIQSPTVNINLWSGGRIQADVEQSRARAESGRQQVNITRDQVALTAVQGYLNWARSLDMQRIATENLAAHRRIHQYISTIVQVDVGRQVDLEQAKGRMDNAALSLEQSQAALADANARLRRMLLDRVPTEPKGIDHIPGQLPTSLENALTYTGETNPVIAQQIAQIHAARANLASARSQHSPQVNATYGKQTNQGTAQGDYVAQLTVTVPIFQGGTIYGSIQTAQAQLEAAEHNLKDTQLNLKESVRSSWTNWKSSENRIKTTVGQVRSGSAVLNGYWEQYRIGRRQVLDLLNAQSDLYNYQVNQVAAKYDALNFRATILANIGRLANSYQANKSTEPRSSTTSSTSLTLPVTGSLTGTTTASPRP
jgi:adhesin transport system outer membrane protein